MELMKYVYYHYLLNDPRIWLHFKRRKNAVCIRITCIFVLNVTYAGLASGIVVQKFGCRKTAIVGGCLITLGLVGSSFGTSMASLFLTLSVITGKSFNFEVVAFL